MATGGGLLLRDPSCLRYLCRDVVKHVERRLVTLGWPELTALDAYRITDIPRRLGPGETGVSAGQPNDPGRTQRLAALIAAYHASVAAQGNGSGALALGWGRHRAGAAGGEPLARGAWATLMSELPSWRAIGGISDGLRPEAGRRTGQRPPPSLE